MRADQHLLSPAEIHHYHENGYLVPEFHLPDALLERLRSEYQKLLQRHPQLDVNFIPSPHVPNYSPGVTESQPWLDLAAVPQLLDIIAQLIGPNFLMWGSAVFGKPAGNGKATPLHQDGEYWPIRPLASTTLWIAIDDANADNGCLRVVPRSHRAAKIHRHRRDDNAEYTLNQVLDDAPLSDADSNAVNVELRAGQVSLHDIYMVHGSRPNHSGARRAGLTYRYMPTSSHFDHQWAGEMARTMGTTDMSERPLYLMRGIDLCGKNDFSVGHSTLS